MKQIEFSDIPESIINKYQIMKNENDISIHNPGYVNISYNGLEIYERNNTYVFENDRAYITIWKNALISHTTIFE